MAEDSIFNIVANILNPFKIAGYIKGAIEPALSAIDSMLGYDDFELSYGGRPKQNEISGKKISIFKVDNEIHFLTNEIIYEIENKINRTKEEAEVFLKGKKISKEQFSEGVYEELLRILEDKKAKTEPSFEAKNSIYEFMIQEKKSNLGYRHYYNRTVLRKYRSFEKKFIERFPFIVKASLAIGNFLGALCIFATSQTGLRIASLASLTAMAISTGGMLPLALVGLYTTGIAISALQQANSKMKLNRLEEEANLLHRWIVLNNKEKTFTKAEVAKKNITKSGQIYRWSKAAFMHFSTYLIETGVPLAFSLLFPIGGIISGAQKGLLIGLSSTSLSVGAISRKAYEDKKMKLREVVEKIKERADIPDYKNINELKVKLNQLLVEKNSPKEELYVKKSWISDYFQGLKEIINPFSPPLDVIDPEKFAQNITIASTAAMVGAAIAAPSSIVPAIATSLITSTTANIVDQSRDKEPKNASIEGLENFLKESEISKEPKKELAKNILKEKSFVERLQESRENHINERGLP